jgi:hypothetical protein
MAVIDAWVIPGAATDYLTLPNPSGVIGHFRTDVGYDPYSILVLGAPDDVNQAGRGEIFLSRRLSNSQPNHGMSFEPTNNNIEYHYNASSVFELSANSDPTNDVWATWALTFAGGTGNMTLRRVPLATATQSHSNTGAAGGTAFSDAQTQEIFLGRSFDCRIAAILILKGVELSQANIEAWTADPLNYGDTLTSTYGADCFFWDDSGTDSGFNGLVAPTLNGLAVRTAGQGPDIPARSAPGGNVTNLFHKHNLGKVLLR